MNGFLFRIRIFLNVVDRYSSNSFYLIINKISEITKILYRKFGIFFKFYTSKLIRVSLVKRSFLSTRILHV